MGNKNPLLSSAVTVFGFWWLFFTLRDFSLSPLEMLRNWAYIIYSTRMWFTGALAGGAAAAWWIWYKRSVVLDSLKPVRSGGMISTLGAVPMPCPAPERADNDKLRLPLTHPLVLAWIETNKEDNAEHVALFMAIWDIYSSHREWPASHRTGGHGGRRLWEHCLGVVDTALQKAPFWKYEGVKVKPRGKPAYTRIRPLKPDFEFNPADPLIAILALAHDIGKLEAYKLKTDGSIGTSESGTGQDYDDLGVSHDKLGARILARLPEYWKLPAEDRNILNLVIGYYHHPSSFPMNRNGTSIGDRICSLLQILIESDKETGKKESGMLEDAEPEVVSEDESMLIYNAFVEIVTEHGRINGIHGDSRADKHFTIGAKHDGYIVIKERELRLLLLAKLNMSIDAGSRKYRVTMSVMQSLLDRNMLLTQWQGLPMTRFLPLWHAHFYNSKNANLITSWPHALIFKPSPTAREMDILHSLPDKKSRMNLSKARATVYTGATDLARMLKHAHDVWGPEDAAELQREIDEEGLVAGSGPSAAADPTAPPPVAVAAAPAASAKSAPFLVPSPAAPGALIAAPAPVQAAPASAPPTPTPVPPAAVAPTLATAPTALPAVLSQIDSTQPWDQVDPIETPHSAIEPDDRAGGLEIDAADLPDMGEEGDAGDEPTMAHGDVVDEGADDLFDGFPSAAPAASAEPVAAAAPTPIEPELGHSPRDTVVLDKLRQSQAAAAAASAEPNIIPKDVGRTIRDEDAPRARDFTKGEKAAEAMKQLQAANNAEITIAPPQRKKKRQKQEVTIAYLQGLVANKRIELAGVQDGHSWVFEPALARIAGATAFLEGEKLGLPVRDIGNGQQFLGIPLPDAAAE